MIRALLLTIALAALAACGGAPVHGQPAPAERVDASGSAAPGATRAPLAPRVAEPRDARNITVCDLLTPAQQASLGIDPATRTTELPGYAPRCQWRTRDFAAVLMVTSATDFPVPGLEGLYLVRHQFDIFEPGELDGYPIVRADDGTGELDCTIYVGIADDQLIWPTVGLVSGSGTPCETATRMASYMISNLPPLR